MTDTAHQNDDDPNAGVREQWFLTLDERDNTATRVPLALRQSGRAPCKARVLRQLVARRALDPGDYVFFTDGAAKPTSVCAGRSDAPTCSATRRQMISRRNALLELAPDLSLQRRGEPSPGEVIGKRARVLLDIGCASALPPNLVVSDIRQARARRWYPSASTVPQPRDDVEHAGDFSAPCQLLRDGHPGTTCS